MVVDKERLHTALYSGTGSKALSHNFDESTWCMQFLHHVGTSHIVVLQVNDTLVQEPTEYGEAEVVEPKQLSE